MTVTITRRWWPAASIRKLACVLAVLTDERRNICATALNLADIAEGLFKEIGGPYVRDKDAVIASMLICEMAAYYRSTGSSLKARLEEIYKEYGRYLNKVDSFEFPGLSGMDTMAGIMEGLRKNPLTEIAGNKVASVTDYEKPEETGLPAANVLIYKLENNETVIVRPSGTEPKIKIYYTTLGKDLAEAEAEKEKLAEALKPIMA